MYIQEAFEKALRGVLKQGRAAMQDSMCAFRTVIDGKELRCSVGHILNDEQLELIDNQTLVADTLMKHLEAAGEPIEIEYEYFNGKKDAAAFLVQIQSAHDSAGHPASFGEESEPFRDVFIRKMKRIAHDWLLEFPKDI